jgi:predicted nucleic acid-binding protein
MAIQKQPMPNSVFLDTNGWLALLHSKDVNHEQATEIWSDLGSRGYGVVLSDWIIAETGNGLARTRIRHLFAGAVDRIFRSPKAEVVMIDRELLAKAVRHFHGHTDKTWGLVDCASFIVMQERGITEAFTSDRDFEQAGFKRLL